MTFTEVITDTRSIQFIACVSTAILVLVLLLIRVPLTEYTKKLSTSKTVVVGSFVIFGFLMAFSISVYDRIWDYELFSSVMMLIAACFSSVAMSYAMINILDEKAVQSNVFNVDIVLLLIVSFFLISSSMGEGHKIGVWFIICLVLFVGQSTYFIIKFDKAYKKSVKELAAYYEEDEDHRLRWIRFCYIIAMLTNLFLLVYLLLPRGFMKLYIAWYILYMVYFTANFVSFLGSHKIILDAFAHKVLSGEDLFPQRQNAPKHKKEEPVIDQKQRDKEFKKIAANIDVWVEEKRYREYDKTREQIAVELDTSKELLQLYFMTIVGK
ncbi:MAG: hypothetical protein LUC24_00560, partial [Bacteroidales bacterium]|nr:hypothetical protein [Bacteroidales bacterium]